MACLGILACKLSTSSDIIRYVSVNNFAIILFFLGILWCFFSSGSIGVIEVSYYLGIDSCFVRC